MSKDYPQLLDCKGATVEDAYEGTWGDEILVLRLLDGRKVEVKAYYEETLAFTEVEE